ncbi:MAG: AAA family ATPase [Candidatus Methanomethyliaceae archaeon]|nr:AAA family ATPase [Candidatus Methanomethyliaceae archaeon]
MIIRRLRLKNIRTYEEGEIEFPNGLILFEGDIGSGKSTLLLAIEFALFGLGNEKGTTLLSLGKNEGEVELTFEVGGREVRVHRSLVRIEKGGGRKGGTTLGGVRQEDCWIEDRGKRYRYSPKEMKEAVLRILGYNEPVDPKAKSIIFRYAVYTPQEEMKEILNRPPEERLQIIRKVLRLEEYKVARDNAKILSRELRSTARLYSEEGDRLHEIERGLKDLEGMRAELGARSKALEEELLDLDVEIRGYEYEVKRLRDELERLSGEAKRELELQTSLDDATARIKAIEQRLKINRSKVEELRRQRDEILSKLKKPSVELKVVEEELKIAKEKLEIVTEDLGVKSQLFKTYSSLIERKVCPTCNQRVDNEEFRGRLSRLEKELKEARENKLLLQKDLERLETLSKEIQEYLNKSSRAEELDERIYDLEEQIEGDEFDWKELLAKVDDLKKKIEGARKAAEEYRSLRSELERVENNMKDLDLKKRKLERERIEAITELKNVDLQASLLEKERERVKEKLIRAKRLMEYATWLDECFIPALERIELTILMGANREFNEEFSRFFAFMVEDPTKSVMVDEDFTPIIMQETYEQEVSNLSGGERTALALAYRLALNEIVQKRSGAEGGLIIMDEPTDGFSKDQVGKIGDLIRELSPTQAIIVSHERELEGAADHIFRIQKENGKSRIYALGTGRNSLSG